MDFPANHEDLGQAPSLKSLTTDERKELPKMGASAGIPNAKAVSEDLAARFPGGARKRSTEPTPA